MDDQRMPHNSNLDGLQNGIYNPQYDSLYPDQSNDGFDSTWNYNSADNAVTSADQSMSLYAEWPQNPITNPHLDIYGRPVSKSPSFQQNSPYHNFGSNQQYQDPHFDPTLVQSPSAEADNSQLHGPYGSSVSANATVAPRALQNGPASAATTISRGGSDQYGQSRYINPTSHNQQNFIPTPSVDQQKLIALIPTSNIDGAFVAIDQEALSSATSSKAFNAFVNFGLKDFEYPINKAALPTPVPRRSRNSLRDLARNDPKLLAKLGKKTAKKTSSYPKIPKDQKPPKVTRPIQTPSGVKEELVSSSDDSSSEEDSSDYDSEDDEPSPLPPKRPEDDPREAVRYDSIKALWRPRRFGASSTDIRDGLKNYWEVVRTIRDRWKTDAQAVVDAEEKNRKGELPLLRSRVKDQRTMIEAAFKAALEQGHPDILEHSGENVAFLFLCYQFLLDRFKESDMDGPLAQSILGILAMCTTLNEDKLAKTHLVKVLPRFAKKGNAKTQELAKKIESAAKAGAKVKSETKAGNPGQADNSDGAVKSPPTSKAVPESIAGVKRAAPGGPSAGQQPAKRIAGAAGSPPAAQVNSKAPLTVAKKVTPANGVKKPIVANFSATVPKVKAVVAKPSSFFSGMQAGAKKPAAGVISKPAVASVIASTIKNRDDTLVADKKISSPATATPSFSFADTLANLTKPKEEKIVAPKAEEKVLPQETPEQRRKRLRREARRGLRVSFKPESVLVEVRYFTHDPDEELGHDEGMTRDVSDVGSEGRMFKQHKDMMEVDEEDDGVREEDLRPHKEPGLIDFDDVDDEERTRNYAPYGGGKQQPESIETAAREQYERETLMAVYASPSDIPPSPKEPPALSDTEEAVDTKSFGAPQGKVGENISRISAVALQAQSQPRSQPTSSAPDISAILAALNPQHQPQQQQTLPQQAPTDTAQDPLSNIQRILASFAQPAGAPESRAPMMQQPAAQPDLASLIANLQPQTNVMPNFGQQVTPAQSNEPNIANLAALVSQFGQGNGNVQFPPVVSGNNFPGLPFPFPNMLQQQQQQQQQDQYPGENEERRRWREQGDDGGDDQRAEKRKKGWTDKRFTQACKYWQQGRCQKGDKCTYLHE